MTPERKAEVNRRLTEFDFPGQCLWTHLELYIHCQHGFANTHRNADYCSDLNALARLEAKLAPHQWEIQPAVSTYDKFHVGLEFHEPSGVQWETYAETEAEARAEAICQYLEQQDEASDYRYRHGWK